MSSPMWHIFKESHVEAWKFGVQNLGQILVFLFATQIVMAGLHFFVEPALVSGRLFGGSADGAPILASGAIMMLLYVNVGLLAAMSIGLGAYRFWLEQKRLNYVPFINLFTMTGLRWTGRVFPYLLVTTALFFIFPFLGTLLGVLVPIIVLGTEEAFPQIQTFLAHAEDPNIPLSGAETFMWIWGTIFSLSFLPGLLLSFRLLPVMPAALETPPSGMRKIWTLTKGKTWWITVTVLLTMLPTAPWAYFAEYYRQGLDGWMYQGMTLLVTITYLINGLVSAAVTLLVLRSLRDEQVSL